MISGISISTDGEHWVPLHGARMWVGALETTAEPITRFEVPKIEIEVTVTHFNRGGFELVMGLHTRRAMRCRKLRSVVRSARRGSR